MNFTDQDWMRDNIFRNNQIVPLLQATGKFPKQPVLSKSLAIEFWHVLSGLDSIRSGSNQFINNRVVWPYHVGAPTYAVWGASGRRFLTEAEWLREVPTDSSVKAPALYTVYSLTLGQELLPNGAFNSGLTSWSSFFANPGGGGAFALVSSSSACEGPCSRFRAASVFDQFSSGTVALTSAVPHVLSFQFTGNGGPAAMQVPRFSASSGGGSGPVPDGLSAATDLAAVTAQTVRYEGFFTPTQTSNARTNFSLSSSGSEILFDSASVRPLLGFKINALSAWSAVVSADPGAAKVVDCASLGWGSTCTVRDIDGKSVSMPTTVPAGTARLLLRWSTSIRQR
jgi:hypothetical protein